MDITINEYVEILLKVDGSFESRYNKISTIKNLLKGAREFSGRNIQTGIYEKKDVNEYDFLNELYETKRFNGLITYLVLLEIIGNIVQSNETICKQNGIRRCLILFSKKITENSISPILNLRNSLVHNFSLCTDIVYNNKPKKKSNLFKYNLNFNETDDKNEIVKVPSIKWDGNFANSDDETYTEIYVENLIDEIEFIYNQVISQLKNNQIKVEIPINELNSRYTIKN